MDLREHPLSTANEEGSNEDSAQHGPRWRVYLEAAVRRQQQLVLLNERLARFLRFTHDVDIGGHKQHVGRSSHAANEESPSQNAGSSSSLPEAQSGRDHTTNSFCLNSFEIEELEANIEKKTQSFRNSLSLYDIRIDTLRRAMNSLNEKNEQLMEENAELRFSSAESHFELQQLKDENEKLRRRSRRVRFSDPEAPRMPESSSQQNLINALKHENQSLKARLDRHKQTLRSGLDNYISRSMEALQNGIPMETGFEKILAYDSGDEREHRSTGNRRSTQSNPALRDQVNQLKENLQSLTDELEHEKFRFERKIKVMQEETDRLKTSLTRKENELHETNRELETALGALQSLIGTGDETQKELDVYRHLLDREESRRSNDSMDSDPASEISPRSWDLGEDAEPMSSSAPEPSVDDDSGAASTRSLEIGKHDVRNGKYVVLENKGDEPLDISRWYLVQRCGKNKVTHRFPSPFIIKPRSKVILWSADVKTTHESPSNYVMAKTVLPWCESGDVDLITKVYDRLGCQISKRETRIQLRGPAASTARNMLQGPGFVQQLEAHSCSIS